MIQRPFELRIASADVPEQLAVGVEFFHTPPVRQKHVALLEKYVGAFENVGRLGGLAGSSVRPEKSGLQRRVWQTGPAGGVWQFTECRVDPAAALMLVNMMHTFHLHVHRLERVRLTYQTVDPSGFALMELPDFFAPLPFLEEFSASSTDVVVDLEFIGEPSKDAQVKFQEAWSAWLEFASLGAFADSDFLPGRTEVYEAMDPAVVFDEMQFAVERAHISPKAFDSLTNMFVRLHHSAHRLRTCAYS